MNTGDIIELGPHRLLCGDCTDLGAVERLLAGRRASYIMTDPPYGETQCSWDRLVDFRPAINLAAQRTAQLSFFSSMRLALSLDRGLNDAGWFFRWDFAWTKPNGMKISDKLPMRAHENILTYARNVKASELYFDGRAAGEKGEPYKKKNSGLLKGGTGQSTRGKEIDVNTQSLDGQRYLTTTFYATSKRQDTGVKHPTAKPVRIVEKFILAMCEPGGIVFDPFLGSGTALIAAQQTGRVCYGIEKDPAYCEDIIARYRALL